MPSYNFEPLESESFTLLLSNENIKINLFLDESKIELSKYDFWKPTTSKIKHFNFRFVKRYLF